MGLLDMCELWNIGKLAQSNQRNDHCDSLSSTLPGHMFHSTLEGKSVAACAFVGGQTKNNSLY